MNRRVAELTLQAIEIRQTGAGDALTHHLLAVRLIWPRPGIAERVTLKHISLTNGRADLRQAAWYDRILFKETILGPFAVDASLSAPLPEGRAHELMQTLVDGATAAAVSGIGRTAGTGLAGTFLRHPLKELAARTEDLATAEERLIATGKADIPAEAADGPVPVALLAPIDVRGAVQRQRPGPPVQHEIALRAGEPNGTLTLDLDS